MTRSSKNMSQHQLVVAALRLQVGDFPAIAAEAGVPYRTVQHIASGAHEDPKSSSVQRLFDALVARGVITGHTPGRVAA